jgi:DNA-binding XRE family transcriptional regulator
MGTINAIERGSWKPSLALAYAISEVLGASVLDLFPLDAFRKLTPLGPLTAEDKVAVEQDEFNTDARRAFPSQAAGPANPEDRLRGDAD